MHALPPDGALVACASHLASLRLASDHCFANPCIVAARNASARLLTTRHLPVLASHRFDQKGAGLHAYEEQGADGGPSFSLDYYDEYGRKMTQKQAFRQLSWKFHGKAPSKKNREKRMLEVEKQLADRSEDKAMSYMHALQAAQQVLNQYLHLLCAKYALHIRRISRPHPLPGAPGSYICMPIPRCSQRGLHTLFSLASTRSNPPTLLSRPHLNDQKERNSIRHKGDRAGAWRSAS